MTETEKKPRRSRTNHKLEKIVLIRKKEDDGKPLDVAYLADIFKRCHMPMTDPKKKGIMVYERRDGDKVLRFKADVDSKYGLMYGSDLVTLAVFMTKARDQIRDKDNPHPEILVFPSTSQMLEALDWPADGPHYRMMLTSIERIQDTTVELIEKLNQVGKAEQIRRRKGGFIDSATLWYNMNRRQLGMKGCENIIVLSPEIMALLREPRGIELDKLTVSRKDVGQMQLFALLRDRCAADDLKEKAQGVPREQWPHKAYTFIPVHGPNSLESQLGWLTPQPEKKARQQIRKWLKGIRATIWKDCPGEPVKGGDGNWRLKIWYYPPIAADGHQRLN